MPQHYNFDQIKVLITSACNSNCTHCFRRGEKNTSSLTESKLIEIVDFAVENQTRRLSFSGGEFFVHPFAYGLLEYCLFKKIATGVLTNALEVDISFFEKRKDLELLSLQVSIDGMKQNHDARRGNGSFDATIDNVIRLNKLGIPITAKMVLDEHNYTDFIEVINLPYFSDFMVLPVALTNATSTNDIQNSVINIDYENTIQFFYKKMATLADKGRRCSMFPHSLAIKYDGGVYPCTEAREHAVYSMGNIKDHSLLEVLHEYNSSDAAKIECVSTDISECNSCKSKNICNRGCRLRAYRFHGKFIAPDPFCCRIFNCDFSEIPIGRLFWGEK